MQKRPEDNPAQRQGHLPHRHHFGPVKKTLAGAVAGFVVLLSPVAEARQALKEIMLGGEVKPPQEGKPRQRGSTLVDSSVQTRTSIENRGDHDTLILTYETSGSPPAAVPIPIDPQWGEYKETKASGERAAIIFGRAIVVTLGYNAALRGDLSLTLDNRPAGTLSVGFMLPYDCIGNLQSVLLLAESRGDMLYFMNNSGKVRSTNISRRGDPYSIAQLELSGGETAEGAGTYMMVNAPGSRTVTFLRYTESAEMETREVELPQNPASAPEIYSRGGGTAVSFGNSTIMLTRTDPGNPLSEVPVLVPQD